tara:strand:+ start:194 stop:397 length:204 start_codon:yes stop_codon:yes gene_type:complete
MIDRLVKITVWLTDAHGVTFNPTDPFNGANDYLDMQSGDDFQVEFIPVPDDMAEDITEILPENALEK